VKEIVRAERREAKSNICVCYSTPWINFGVLRTTKQSPPISIALSKEGGREGREKEGWDGGGEGRGGQEYMYIAP
jgi:hypothetical protein